MIRSESPVSAAVHVAATLRAHRYVCANEAELQAGVAEVLNAAGLPFAREVPLGDLRLDLCVGRIAIECKVDGSPVAVARQCQAYLAREEVQQLILVTTKPQHAKFLPEGVHVVLVGGIG